MARDIYQTFRTLQDDAEPLEGAALLDLSNLTREEQTVLAEAWPRIPLDKRRRLVALMGEAADEDVQLDYRAVFRRGLDDADAEVRRLSVEGLWEDESVTLVRPLLALLRQDESMSVRASAATALGRFVLQGELKQLSEERLAEMVEALVGTVGATELPVAVRRRAVESLGYSGDERVPGIIQRAHTDDAEEMRISALFAMGRSADEQWAATVRHELDNENPAIRFEAVRAAGELGDSRAVQPLVALIADSDKEVREMAVWALGEIGGPVAKAALRKVVTGEDRALRQLARDSLAEMALLDEQSLLLFDEAPTDLLTPEPDADDEWEEDEDDEEWDDWDDEEDDDEDDEEWDEEDEDEWGDEAEEDGDDDD